MQRIVLSHIFLVLLTTASTSQNYNLTGKVVNIDTGAPLPQANVVVVDSRLGTTSDAHGEFILSGLPQVFKIKVSVMGYKPAIQSVILPLQQNEPLVIKLAPMVLPMDAVTVTGKMERNVIEEPTLESTGLELSTSVIQQREIRQQGAKTVVDALQFVPGSLVESRGRKVKQFVSLRGQRYPYPEYSINGAWQREFHETSYFFSAADIERIEVIRSSAALLNGANGMAGLINIITKEYKAPTTSAELEYGSFNSYRAHLSHGATFGSLSYAAAVGTHHTDGPSDMNTAENITNIYSHIKWQPTHKLSIQHNLFYYDGKRQLRLAVAPAAKRFQTEISRFDPFRSTLTNLKLNYRLSDKASTEVLAYYSARDPEYVVEDPETSELSRVNERDSEWGLNFIQSIALSDRNRLRIGGLTNHWIAPNGKRFYVGRRNDISTFSGVLVDEHRFNALTLDAGIRWSRSYLAEYGAFNIEGSGGKFRAVAPILDEWEPSLLQGSVGGSYLFPGLTSLHVNVAVGEIQPRRGSLDENLQVPDNEIRIKLDIGVRSIFASFGRLSLVGFLTRQKNAIVLSGKTTELENRVMPLYLNRDQDQYGVELEARMTAFAAVQGFLNITAMKTRARTDDGWQENKEYPEVISSAGLYIQKNNIDITVLAKYISFFENDRFAAAAPDGMVYPQPLGDFFTMDVNAGYSFNILSRTRIYVEIKNLFDTAYSTVVGYPDFGRRLTFGLRYTI